MALQQIEWKGGNSKKWENLGKPSLLGRLNDLLHIIYLKMQIVDGIVKKILVLVLKEGLLKENIDGEASYMAYILKVKLEKRS